MKTYQETLNYIHKRPKLHPRGDLTNIRRILKALGDPQNKFKTIHVTGTNGKGSVSLLLSQLIEETGFKTGTFTSPFIRYFNERIQINGQPITDTDLIDWTNKVKTQIEAIQQTDPEFDLVEFELVTAIMFAYFADNGVEVGVIEVGIGGTHDKTNVIDPMLSVITTIGEDHLQLIGPTIQDVAKEKSGIIKANRPVVVGDLRSDVFPIVSDWAKSAHSSLYRLNHDFIVKNVKILPDYQQSFDFEGLGFKIKDLKIHNIARFEVDNTAMALMAFLLFCQQMHIDVWPKEIRSVLMDYVLIGRMEIVDTEPTIMLDGAHNPEAMTNLVQTLQTNFPQTQVHLVAAFMQDKAIDEILKILHRQPNIHLYLTTLDMPRAADKEQLKPLMAPKDQYFEPWQRSFLEAYHDSSVDDLLLIAGSIYLVSAARNYLLEGGHQHV